MASPPLPLSLSRLGLPFNAYTYTYASAIDREKKESLAFDVASRNFSIKTELGIRRIVQYRGLNGPSRLAEMKRYTDIRWIKGTEIGVVEARVIKILCEGATGKNERGETKYRIGLDLQEGEFVDLAGNGGGSFSWRAKAEVGVDAFLPR